MAYFAAERTELWTLPADAVRRLTVLLFWRGHRARPDRELPSGRQLPLGRRQLRPDLALQRAAGRDPRLHDSHADADAGRLRELQLRQQPGRQLGHRLASHGRWNGAGLQRRDARWHHPDHRECSLQY